MNIGIFTDCYYPQINGVVTSVMTLQEELKKRGHKVTVITVDVPGYIETSKDVLRIKSIPFKKYKDFRIAVPVFSSEYKLIKSLNLDIIHTHTEFTIGLLGRHIAKSLDIPILHTYHTLYEDYSHYVSRHNSKVVKKLIRKGSKLYVEKYNAVIAPSDKTKYILRNYGVKNDIHVIPTGINIKEFEKIDNNHPKIKNIRHNLGINADDKIILSLGRISKEKSIDFIIKQMKALNRLQPKVKLLVVGDGPYRTKLEEFAKENGVDHIVNFIGGVPFHEVPYYYSMADLFISASKTETQGLTIIEAMASRLPVIVYNDDNIKGIVIEDVTGRLFTTSEELTSCINDGLNNPLKTKRMMENGCGIIQKLTKETFGENAEKVYENLLTQKSSTDYNYFKKVFYFHKRKQISNF